MRIERWKAEGHNTDQRLRERSVRYSFRHFRIHSRQRIMGHFVASLASASFVSDNQCLWLEFVRVGIGPTLRNTRYLVNDMLSPSSAGSRGARQPYRATN